MQFVQLGLLERQHFEGEKAVCSPAGHGRAEGIQSRGRPQSSDTSPMPKPKQHRELGRRDRWVQTVVPGLAGLACAAVALLCAIGIGSELSGWVRSLGWASTSAQIEQNDLRRTGPKSGPWTLVVRYHYWVDDTRYEGTRVGWNDSAWVGQAWRKERFNDLVDARNRGRPVLVWYDPKDPAAAVLDRRLRWGLLLVLLPAGLFSSLLAWAAAWLVRKLWRQPVPD